MSAFAVIVAAGQGSRLPGAVPKQYLLLDGAPLYLRALRAAEGARSISGSVLVVPAADLERVRGEIERCSPPLAKLRDVVAGGARRQDSVRAGTESARRSACEIVAVHDAARPFATPALFDAVCEEARRTGAAIPALPVADTVKETGEGGRVARTLDRSRLLLSQTPQAFRAAELIESLDWAEANGATVTDEASLFEQRGRPVAAVPGDPRNVKITRPEDLELARALAVSGGDGEERIGLGEDMHPLAAGRPLVLGGVAIPHEKGLQGHSDADAAAHALVDAVCGAAGLPSIGELFPDTDPRWRGESSLVLLEAASARAAGDGWRLVNADIVVLCQAPRLQPHVEKMKAALAGALAALGAAPERVGIRGKSPEGLGPEGRGEGISARAVVLLRRRRV